MNDLRCYLIVIYNKSVYQSVTFQSLCDLIKSDPHHCHIIIWDNSPVPQHRSAVDSFSKDVTIKYKHSGFNESLSVIYNKIASECFDNGATFFTIFDDDSSISSNFKSAVDSVTEDLLILPKVCSELSGSLISPRYQKYNYLRNKCSITYLPKTIEDGPKQSLNFFAVASGLTISKYVWSMGVRFDEKLSFYGVDTEFCNDYASVTDKFYLINTLIFHSASNELKESRMVKNWRVSKYYEHWRYQLIKYLAIPKPIAYFYVLLNYILYRLKNLCSI